MPDPVVTPPVTPAGPEPAPFDPNKFREDMMSEVQQYMSTHDKDNDAVHHTDQRRAEPRENPLEAIIDPVVGPRLQQTRLIAEAARDSAVFYAGHPEAVEYMTDIEKAFNVMLENGTPITHEATWDWYRGKNQAKFFDKAKADEKKALEVAEAAITLPAGQRPVAGTPKDAHSATDDELAAGLKDVAF